MSALYILDEHGEPKRVHDYTVWGRWFEEAKERRRVAFDKIGDVTISTVFLGLDHGYGSEVLLFETMVFEGPLDGEMDRASTRTQALEQHAAMVARVKASATA